MELDNEFLNINKFALDDELVKQAGLYYQWGVKHADAKRDVEQLKQTLDVVRAEVAHAIRKKPTKYGLEKVTENALTVLIPNQPEYKQAQKKLNDAKHSVDVYAAIINALEHKKRMLEKLCDLFAREYFAEPILKSDAIDYVTETTANKPRPNRAKARKPNGKTKNKTKTVIRKKTRRTRG